MTQPKWKLIANLGDVSPLDYGGKFVLVDETGVYPPEMEILEVFEEGFDDDDDDEGQWEVSRIVLEQCTYIDGILSNNKYHPNHDAWFADKINRLADCVGMPEEELIALLCSPDPLELAQGYESIICYFGAHEFDHYPLTFTSRKELEERYLRLGIEV